MRYQRMLEARSRLGYAVADGRIRRAGRSMLQNMSDRISDRINDTGRPAR